jgi:hypothetical protein
MSKEVIFEDPILRKHLSADVAEKSGAVAAAVRRARQQVFVQRHRVTKYLESSKSFPKIVHCKLSKDKLL